MKLCLTVVFCCLSLLAVAGEDNSILPFKLQQGSLDNGLQIVTVPFDSPGLVAFSVLVRVGSRDEVEQGKTGFAHFFEHCMFRGTERFPSQSYDAMMLKMAASGNANTWFDRTYYYYTGNASNLENMFDIESDRFRNLKYSEHGFKTEAGAVLGEYTKNFAVPSRRMSEALQALAFNKHTYGHTTMGYIEDIKNMPSQYNYSLEFYDRFYRPEYCTLIISGDVKHETVMAMASKYFGDWKRGKYVAKVPVEPAQTEARSTHVKFDGDTNMVGIYYKSPAFTDRATSKLALDLLLAMYFSSNSEIYAELVREKQLVQRFNIQDWDTRDPFIVGVSANLFKVEDTAAVRTRMEQAYRDMIEAPIDARLLEQLKSRRRYSMAAQLDRPMNVAQELANFIWLTGDPQTMERYYQILAKITVADLKKAAETYFVEEGRLNISLSQEETAR